MSETATLMPLQLRVLAGLHEGAVVALGPDLSHVSLAASDHADVLLRDAPAAAEFSAGQGGAWMWREPGFEQEVLPGQAWRWGNVVLALAQENQAWPQALPPLAFDRQRFEPVTEAQPPADDDTRIERDTPAAEVDGEAGAQPETDSSDPAEARPADANSAATPTEGRRAVRWALLAAASIVLILGGLFALIWANGAGKVEASAPVQAGNAATAQVNLAQVNKVIADLGLAAAVKARVREDGRLIVRGVVADNEQLEALTIAVSRLTWRYTPLVLTQAEFVVRALALAPNLPEGIVPLAEEGGLLVLRAKREDVDWVLARQLVDSELPEAVAIDHRSFGGAQVAQAVTQTVTQAVTPPAVGKPASPAAAARSTALALSPLPSVATDSPTPVPAPLEAVPAPAPPPLPEVPAISAVIGGPRPFLLLGSGEKWQPGGKIGDLVLQSISNEAVVFEDSLGRTLRRAR